MNAGQRVGSYHSRSAGPTGPSTTVRTAARAMGSGAGGGGAGRRPPRQIGRRVDAPAAGQLGVVGLQRPAVGTLVPFVLGAGALQRHATGVVAGGPDGRDLVGREHDLARG